MRAHVDLARIDRVEVERINVVAQQDAPAHGFHLPRQRIGQRLVTGFQGQVVGQFVKIAHRLEAHAGIDLLVIKREETHRVLDHLQAFLRQAEINQQGPEAPLVERYATVCEGQPDALPVLGGLGIAGRRVGAVLGQDGVEHLLQDLVRLPVFFIVAQVVDRAPQISVGRHRAEGLPPAAQVVDVVFVAHVEWHDVAIQLQRLEQPHQVLHAVDEAHAAFFVLDQLAIDPDQVGVEAAARAIKHFEDRDARAGLAAQHPPGEIQPRHARACDDDIRLICCGHVGLP